MTKIKTKTATINKLTFSGHESFQCRQHWLKRGYDLINNGKSFQDDDAMIDLGVGKNMVSAIRFWMKAFAIIDSGDKITKFGKKLLDDNGWDPYLEDDASLWLLHYKLVKTNLASTYNIVFNDLRKERVEFTKDNFTSTVKRKIESNGGSQINEKTFGDDFSVFTKMYVRTDFQSKDKEDTFSGLLTDLGLVKMNGKYYVIENSEKEEIPDDVILACILDEGEQSSSIDLMSIQNERNSVGSIFAISKSGLSEKCESIANKSKGSIVYKEHAGVRELQIKGKLDFFKVLGDYYAK